jgi:hypothetical protein
MHSAQVMQPICGPSRMSMPVGQTATHWLQSMQSPNAPGCAFACFQAAARFAAPVR